MGMPITAPRFTLHDLDALPDDGNRYELLDGAYLAMGVTEVWFVDIDTKSVEVFWNGGAKVVKDTIRWHVPDIDRIVAIDLPELFA